MDPDSTTLARRRFGPTELEVTPLCIGTAALGNMPETFDYAVPEDRALATLDAFFASPINFLDTAASYGDGESERRIGLALTRARCRPALCCRRRPIGTCTPATSAASRCGGRWSAVCGCSGSSDCS